MSTVEASPTEPARTPPRPWWRGAAAPITPTPGPAPSVGRDLGRDGEFGPLMRNYVPSGPGGPDAPMPIPKRVETRGRKPKITPDITTHFDLDTDWSDEPPRKQPTTWNRSKIATMPDTLSVAPAPAVAPLHPQSDK